MINPLSHPNVSLIFTKWVHKDGRQTLGKIDGLNYLYTHFISLLWLYNLHIAKDYYVLYSLRNC